VRDLRRGENLGRGEHRRAEHRRAELCRLLEACSDLLIVFISLRSPFSLVEVRSRPDAQAHVG
jgi:hypothetical protein